MMIFCSDAAFAPFGSVHVSLSYGVRSVAFARLDLDEGDDKLLRAAQFDFNFDARFPRNGVVKGDALLRKDLLTFFEGYDLPGRAIRKEGNGEAIRRLFGETRLQIIVASPHHFLHLFGIVRQLCHAFLYLIYIIFVSRAPYLSARPAASGRAP